MPSIANTFHVGELAAQDKAGTRGVAAELLPGKSASLSFSRNHDAFLAAQSFAVVSSVQQDGQVWVTPLFGKPGDITAASESELVISPRTIPKGDYLHSAIASPDTPLSMLAIDLVKRIRHRINGVAITNQDNINLHLQVNEYSPNCPKYINRRELIPSSTPINNAATRKERVELTVSDHDFIQSMDTLWIGSYAPKVGADTNHRGGKQGFIRVTSNNTIEWPEYRGNGMFYTSGNLEVNDRAGVTLVDFETGSIIQMTGHATVDWNHDGAYEGATRLMKFRIEKLVRTDNVTNHRWKLLDYSPYNPSIVGREDQTGSVKSDLSTVVTLAKIVTESTNVKTFRWVAPRNIPFLPGQYATFEFDKIPGGSASEVRTWTLSETPNSIKGDNTLDITVKRKGLVTNWLHDHAQVGLKVNLNGVQGDMTAITFDEQRKIPKPNVSKHLLLLSAGIGITPNFAIVRGVGAFQLQNDTAITMIHVERNENDLIGQSELHRRAKNYPNFKYTNIITSKEGRLTRKRLSNLLPKANVVALHEAYVCGPESFMSDMTEHLVALGVPAGNIHTESFDF